MWVGERFKGWFFPCPRKIHQRNGSIEKRKEKNNVWTTDNQKILSYWHITCKVAAAFHVQNVAYLEKVRSIWQVRQNSFLIIITVIRPLNRWKCTNEDRKSGKTLHHNIAMCLLVCSTAFSSPQKPTKPICQQLVPFLLRLFHTPLIFGVSYVNN